MNNGKQGHLSRRRADLTALTAIMTMLSLACYKALTVVLQGPPVLPARPPQIQAPAAGISGHAEDAVGGAVRGSDRHVLCKRRLNDENYSKNGIYVKRQLECEIKWIESYSIRIAYYLELSDKTISTYAREICNISHCVFYIQRQMFENHRLCCARAYVFSGGVPCARTSFFLGGLPPLLWEALSHSERRI
jgi:hypothetical protein